MPSLIYTTTSSRKKLNKKPGHTKAKENHDKFLKSMGLNDVSSRVAKRGSVVSIPERFVRSGPQTSDRIHATSPAKPDNKYTGTLIKGIATMHKSNAVPVISKEQATDISNMRR
jgi:dienelactone hydrolase